MILRLLLAALVFASFAPTAAAQIAAFPRQVRLLPVPLSTPPVLRDFGLDHAPSCTQIYLDETTSTGYYVPMGANVELADDLHTTVLGREAMCAFDLGYYKPTPGSVDARVTFYDNTPADDLPGTVLAGPFLIEGLPTGVNAFHIEVPGGIVDGDLWMGVAFADDATGLLTYSPATLGLTHDLAWISPPGVIGNFNGAPPADFYLGVYSSPWTPAVVSTWGGLKAHYR